jgi:hypothetical protein
LPEYALFPPVIILFDHPIGVTGLSIEQGSTVTQRMCEIDDAQPKGRHHPRKRMIQYSATPKFYAAVAEYWMPAFAGMTVP